MVSALAAGKGRWATQRAMPRDAVARMAAERANPLVAHRLEPPFPTEMPYLYLYPMSKKREAGQNCYGALCGLRGILGGEGHGSGGVDSRVT